MSYIELHDNMYDAGKNRDERLLTVSYDQAFPFAFNPNGILVHRVRWVHDHYWYGDFSHQSVGYWCGNLSNRAELYEFMPDGLILCARCEAFAVQKGLKSAEQLNGGKHVHVGGLRAVRYCCKPNN